MRAQAQPGQIQTTDSAQRGPAFRLVQVTGWTDENLGVRRDGGGDVGSGRSREQECHGGGGDAAGEKGDDATVVGMHGFGCGVVRMEVGVELRADREDREQQHEHGRPGREEAVEGARRVRVVGEGGHEAAV